MRRWTLVASLMVAGLALVIPSPDHSQAASSDIVSIKGPNPAPVRKVGKNGKVIKSAARREPQVIAVGGASTRKAANTSRRAGLAGPSFSSVTSTPIRISAEDSFGVRLIRNRNHGFYNRHSKTLLGKAYYNSRFSRTSRGGRGRNNLPSFIGVTP